MFRIYSVGASNSYFTGHLHTTQTREGAETWVEQFRAQGYTGVFIAGDDMTPDEITAARLAAI